MKSAASTVGSDIGTIGQMQCGGLQDTGEKCDIEFSGARGEECRPLPYRDTPDDYPEDEESVGQCGPGSADWCEESELDLVKNVMGEEVSVNIAELQPGKLMECRVNVLTEVCNALLDTGAQISMVSASLIERLGLPIDMTQNEDVKGVGIDNVVTSLGKVSLALVIHGFLMDPVQFTVMPAKEMRRSMLIGVDFLRANRLSINITRRRLTRYEGSRMLWELYLDNELRGSCTRIHHEICCVAAEDISSEASTVVVPIRWDADHCVNQDLTCSICDTMNNDELFFDGNRTGQNKHVRVWPGILDVSCESPKILLSQVDTRMVKIHKGDKIGVLSSLVDLGEGIHTAGGAESVLEGRCENDPNCETSVNIVERVSLVSGGWNLEAIQEKVVLPDELSDEQKAEVYQMLLNRGRVLSKDENDVGCSGLTAHRIELYDHTPIRQRPRRFAEPLTEAIEKQCRELESLDIIEISNSPWSSPVVPVRKKDGTLRLAVDYRRLNAVTKPDRFPMPNLTDAVFNLYGKKWFTSIDLVRGYYQMPIEEDSREFTAFSTPRNHWQFKRLSFGLKNAPAAFQREMQEVLRGFPWKDVIIYIDDVCIMSSTYEEHIALVAKVLMTLEKYGLKIKMEKCYWFQESVPFLGHIVSRTGLSKPREYMDKIKNFPRPTTIRELREFLGLLNFQRKFVPNCSSLAKPLSKLTGGKAAARLKWTVEMEAAFESLKSEMAEEIELAFPQYGEGAEKIELFVDASGYGCGACLMQWQGGLHRVIAYASMTFSRAQQRYSTTEREIAAVRWGIKSFRAFLYGSPFVLYTDHMALLYLHNMKDVDSRLARTIEDLADFEVEIRFRPGTQNQAADALSRLRTETALDSVNRDEMFNPRWLPGGLSVVQNVSGGGDSLFDSLFLLLQEQKDKYDSGISVPSTSLELRRVLVEMLIASPAKYALKPNRNLKKTLRMMLQEGQLPLLEVLLAFSRAFRTIVYVHYGSRRPLLFKSGKGVENMNNRIHLQCLAGVHFNPLQELDGFALALPEADSASMGVNFYDAEVESGEVGVVVVEQSRLIEVQGEEGPIIDLSEDQNSDIVRDSGRSMKFSTSTSIMTFRLDNRSFTALLDTGAEVCAIDEGAFEHIREDCKTVIPMDMIGRYYINGLGSQRSPIKRVVSLSLDADIFRTEPFPFAVMGRGVLPCAFIFGANFIGTLDMDIDFGSHIGLDGLEGAVGYGGVVGQKFSMVIGQVEVNAAFASFSEDSDQSSIYETAASESSEGSCGQEDGLLGDQEQVFLSRLFERADIYAMQSRDYHLRQLRRHILDRRPISALSRQLKQFKRYVNDMRIVEDILVYCPRDFSVPVVSYGFLIEGVMTMHYELAHLGRHKLVACVNRHMWHPSLGAVAYDVCVSCELCQLVKTSSQPLKPPVWKIETTRPFELISMDLKFLPTTRSGYIGMLVVIDHYSKWVSAIPISDRSSRTISNAFEFGMLPFLPRCPERVLTDNGGEFVGRECVAMFARYGILHTRSSPFNPSSNGCVERVNRTLGSMLSSLAESPESWELVLPRVVLVYNGTLHSSIGMSPSSMILGQSHNIPERPLVSVQLQRTWRVGHPNFVPFRMGQLVAMKVNRRGNRKVDKFSARYSGPYEIREARANNTYCLTRISDGQQANAHHTKLKVWVKYPKYLARHPCAVRYLPGLKRRDKSNSNREQSVGTKTASTGDNTQDSSDSDEKSAGTGDCGVGESDSDDNSSFYGFVNPAGGFQSKEVVKSREYWDKLSFETSDSEFSELSVPKLGYSELDAEAEESNLEGGSSLESESSFEGETVFYGFKSLNSERQVSKITSRQTRSKKVSFSEYEGSVDRRSSVTGGVLRGSKSVEAVTVDGPGSEREILTRDVDRDGSDKQVGVRVLNLERWSKQMDKQLVGSQLRGHKIINIKSANPDWLREPYKSLRVLYMMIQKKMMNGGTDGVVEDLSNVFSGKVIDSCERGLIEIGSGQPGDNKKGCFGVDGSVLNYDEVSDLNFSDIQGSDGVDSSRSEGMGQFGKWCKDQAPGTRGECELRDAGRVEQVSILERSIAGLRDDIETLVNVSARSLEAMSELALAVGGCTRSGKELLLSAGVAGEPESRLTTEEEMCNQKEGDFPEVGFGERSESFYGFTQNDLCRGPKKEGLQAGRLQKTNLKNTVISRKKNPGEQRRRLQAGMVTRKQTKWLTKDQPPLTRSKGQPLNLPNVQEYILERKRKTD